MEKVNHPEHYKPGTYEVINVIEAHELNFNRGNVLKYLLRAGAKSKDTEVEDLQKAIWYLNREIDRIKNIIAYEKESDAWLNFDNKEI